MVLKETMNTLKRLLTEIGKDMEKAARGNKTASQRVRVNTIRLEKTAKLYRKESVSLEKKLLRAESKKVRAKAQIVKKRK